ncbi:transferrin-binding protein-like solute binding protein [Tsuneonella sp. YG55]|uniref:Transferrin-binding protein-like solute binding protein n=1 Tax=Tsuneonella litorea TaxID=2976475 RepID=A0A9X2W537_9SPHN|nr:transferrin-binding protein-like solute binding protein [Tsuneonella litorea]MCT2559796.1 transferrin-binding protein-like solute binding protein [Tsuneonella litorea]
MNTQFRRAAAAALVMTLTGGCGEGSGGPTQGAAVSSGQTGGSGTTSNAPSNTYPPAPANANGPVSYDAVGWSKDHKAGTISEIAPADFTFAWDGQSYYNVAIARVGAGRLRYFFGRNGNASVFSLEQADGTVIPVAVSWVATEPLLARAESVFYHYPASGTSTPAREFSGALILGRLTGAAAMPTAGTRTYRFQSQGTGTAEFTADFASGTLAGNLAISYQDAWGPYPPTPATLSNLVWSPDRTSFSATYTLAGTPGEGTLKGWFFGPGAETLGLAWKGPVGDPYDSTTTYEVFGAWRLD